MKTKFQISREYKLEDYIQFTEFSKEILYSKNNKKTLNISIFLITLKFIFTILLMVLFIYLCFWFDWTTSASVYFGVIASQLLIYSIIYMLYRLGFNISYFPTFKLPSFYKNNVLPINKFDVNNVIYSICKDVNGKYKKEYEKMFDLIKNNSVFFDADEYYYFRDKVISMIKNDLSHRKNMRIFDRIYFVKTELLSLERFTIINCDIKLNSSLRIKKITSTRFFYIFAIVILILFAIISLVIWFELRGRR